MTEQNFFCCWFDDDDNVDGGHYHLFDFALGKGAVCQQINQKTAVCCIDSQMNCVAEQNLVTFFSN